MTPPTPPPRSPDDRQFARDVAREIDRRRMRRRVTLWTALLAVIAVALMYLRFGDGLGIGGGRPGLGGGDDGSARARSLAEPARCVIRIAASGLTVDGRAMSRDDAVAACKTAPGVDVRVAGDVREGDWQALRAALRAAGIQNLTVIDPSGKSPDEAEDSAAAGAGSAHAAPRAAAPPGSSGAAPQVPGEAANGSAAPAPR